MYTLKHLHLEYINFNVHNTLVPIYKHRIGTDSGLLGLQGKKIDCCSVERFKIIAEWINTGHMPKLTEELLNITKELHLETLTKQIEFELKPEHEKNDIRDGWLQDWLNNPGNKIHDD